MTYAKTGKIQAADYNDLVRTINYIFGLGGKAIVIGDSGATYTIGQTIVINGNIVTLSTAPASIDHAVSDINGASIANITAFNSGNAVKIESDAPPSAVNIVLAEGSGTALADLGFTAGTYYHGNFGYGGNSDNVSITDLLSTPKSAGNLITNDDWLNLRNAYVDCAAHQDTTLTVQQKSDPDDLVGSFYTAGETITINSNVITLNTGISTQIGTVVNPSFEPESNQISINGTPIDFTGTATATGTVLNPMVSLGDEFIINGVTITFTTGTGTLSDVITDIDANVPGVTPSDAGGYLQLGASSTIDIVTQGGIGTALTDLGFADNVPYLRTTNLSNVLSSINAQSGTTFVSATNDGSDHVKLTGTNTEIMLADIGGSILSDLGFIAGTYLQETTYLDAITDINNASISGVSAVADGTAIKIISEVTLTLDEGGSALTDMGFVGPFPLTRKVLPETTELDMEDIIYFFTELLLDDQATGKDLRRNDDEIIRNFSSADGESSYSMSVHASARTFLWYSTIRHRFEITFSSQDEARAFFNSGGEIWIDADHDDGSVSPPYGDQTQTWDMFLDDLRGDTLNPFIFDAARYFSLTTTGSFQTLNNPPDGYTSDVYFPVGPYAIAPMVWKIQAHTNTLVDPSGRGGNGTTLTIQSVFIDQHAGYGGSPPIGDGVDGTFTSTITIKTNSGIFSKTIPSFVELIPMTSGV